MTNQAIVTILDYLYSEARTSAQAGFAIKDLLRDLPVDPAQRSFAEAGLASADQVLRSIDDVRELLASAQASAASLEEFDLTRCVAEIVEALNLASERRVKLIVLDAPEHPLLVVQDQRAIEQMLTRILDTTLKLEGVSGAPLRVSLAQSENLIRLAIAVSGVDLAGRVTGWLNASPEHAMPQNPADVLFGIALMVAGKWMRAIGGKADLTPGANGNCAVALDLPACAAGLSRPSLTRRARPDALNILVAEDFDESFALTRMALEDESVWRAHDGEEALHMMEQQRFDLVIMDIHMPGMDGYTTIRSMRNWETQTGNARTPIVVLSSDDVETQRRSAAECGCSGFLHKPLHYWDLTPLLDRLK